MPNRLDVEEKTMVLGAAVCVTMLLALLAVEPVVFDLTRGLGLSRGACATRTRYLTQSHK